MNSWSQESLSVAFGLTLLMLVFLAACSSGVASLDRQDAQLLEVHLPWADPELSTSLEQDRHAQVEDLIAECMDNAGFEYVPVLLESAAFGPGLGVSRSEYARRFGFGISTNEETFAAFSESTESAGDPNREHQESLSTERANAFAEQRSQCSNEAHEQIPQPSTDFDHAVDDLVDSVRADPAVVEAEAEWVECVRADIPQLPQFSSLLQLTQWFSAESDRLGGRPDELARLQDLEREVAVRHLECEAPLIAVMRDVASTREPEVAAEFGDFFDRQREFLGS